MNKETKLNKLTNIPFIVCVFDRLDAPEAWSAPRTHTHTRARKHTHAHAHAHTHTRANTHTHTHTHTHRGAGTGGAAAPPVFCLWATVNCCE